MEKCSGKSKEKVSMCLNGSKYDQNENNSQKHEKEKKFYHERVSWKQKSIFVFILGICTVSFITSIIMMFYVNNRENMRKNLENKYLRNQIELQNQGRTIEQLLQSVAGLNNRVASLETLNQASNLC